MKIYVKHNGYYGVISYSIEDGLYVARAVGLRHSRISCHGATLDNAKEEFIISIDHYLEVCEAEGWPPCVTDPVVAREMEKHLNSAHKDYLPSAENKENMALAYGTV